MILLSKVFPTLDCASCISTPKMAATIHHPNIDVLTYSEVEGIERRRRRRLRGHESQKPKFVDGRLHRLPPVRDGLHRRRARRVQRRHGARGAPPTSPSRRRCPRRPSSSAPASRPARTRARPASRPTATSPSSAAASTRRPSTWSGGDTSRREPRARLLRALRGGVHPRRARGPAPDPPAQALHRRPHYAADGRPGIERARAERQEGGRRRLGPGRPHRRLAAGPQGLRRQDLRGGARRPAACCASASPPTACPTTSSTRHRQRHRSRRRDRDGRPRRRPGRRSRTQGFDAVLVATGTHEAVELGVPGEDLAGVLSAIDFLRRRQARRGRRPGRQDGRRGRRRQRRHRRGAHRPSAGRRVSRDGLAGESLERDARPRLGGRGGARGGRRPVALRHRRTSSARAACGASS